MIRRDRGMRNLAWKLKIPCLRAALSASTQMMKLNIRFARGLRSVQRHTPYRWVRTFTAGIHRHYLSVFLFLAKLHCRLAFRLDEIRQHCAELNASCG